jgi:beta-N-acetylhexosaminidase
MIRSVDADQRTRRRREREAVRRRRARLGVAALVAFVVGVVLGAAGGDAPESGRTAPASQPAEQARQAAAAVDELSLEQQVGRMVILRFVGTEPPGYVRRALREGRAAGAILFRDNVVSPGQMRSLTGTLA